MSNNNRFGGSCPCFQRISRRDFLKIGVVAGAGLLVACKSTPSETSSEESQEEEYISYCGTAYCLACTEYKKTCAGCLAGEDEQVSQTAADCPVRNCSRGRELANCAYCGEYPCDKLENLYTKYGGMAAARAKLEEIRQSLP